MGFTFWCQAMQAINTENLRRFVDTHGKIPLAWAGSTSEMNYLNLGDALSPVMVALCTSMDITRVPSASANPRLAAVGTIGHGMRGGEVWFWGTGCSPHLNPAAKKPVVKEPFHPPADTKFHVHATRGPVSARLLNGDKPVGAFGDPVWLLPRFHKPKIQKKWKLGVILHLSELSDRAFDAHPRNELKRYNIPAELAGQVKLINTVTEISPKAMQERIDEILSCERIVSTSLHGMVYAESYGIPCLHFAAGLGAAGLHRVPLVGAGTNLDLRIVDLYMGLGAREIPVFNQPRTEQTDWSSLMQAIDQNWEARTLDESRLLEALPLPVKMIAGPKEGSVFDLPIIQGLALQHDVRELRIRDQESVFSKP